jgi:predicted nucleic acid-binding protein
MPLVVADTSPLNYLLIIGSIEILPRLYGSVTIPDVVISELSDGGAPAMVREWALKLPDWVTVSPTPRSDDPALAHLDGGERGAILIAEMEANSVLLIDEGGREG